MMPDQSQGACMAIEDAACLGLVFSRQHFTGSIPSALKLYQSVRKHRVTRVQAAAARARENIHERIGFSDNTEARDYSVKSEGEKLTFREVKGYDMKVHVGVLAGEMERNGGEVRWGREREVEAYEGAILEKMGA